MIRSIKCCFCVSFDAFLVVHCLIVTCFSFVLRTKFASIVLFILNIVLVAKSGNISKLQSKSVDDKLYSLKEKKAWNRSITPFSTIIDDASTNIASYSNGDESHIPIESDYSYKMYIRIKYQCVECVRRWLFLRKYVFFIKICWSERYLDWSLQCSKSCC